MVSTEIVNEMIQRRYIEEELMEVHLLWTMFSTNDDWDENVKLSRWIPQKIGINGRDSIDRLVNGVDRNCEWDDPKEILQREKFSFNENHSKKNWWKFIFNEQCSRRTLIEMKNGKHSRWIWLMVSTKFVKRDDPKEILRREKILLQRGWVKEKLTEISLLLNNVLDERWLKWKTVNIRDEFD